MCTVVLRHAPGEPLRILGVRDEFAQRPWRPPGRHWPGIPLIGGLDEQAGGTWLAVHPELSRVACVLNGRGSPSSAAYRRSRGELPMRAALEGGVRDLPIAEYDPFHLLYVAASPAGGESAAWLLSWDGQRARTTELGPGTHVLTNAGQVYPDGTPDPKGAYLGPRFQDSTDWQALADGDGLALDDPRAIIVRRELPDGRIWGTSSITFLELSAGHLRYEFRVPGEPWKAIK